MTFALGAAASGLRPNFTKLGDQHVTFQTNRRRRSSCSAQKVSINAADGHQPRVGVVAAAHRSPPAQPDAEDRPAAKALLQGLLTNLEGSDVRLWALAAVLGGAVLLGDVGHAAAASEAPHHAQAVLGDLAEDEEFWSNVGRYISYFFSVLLGTAYVAIKPILGLLKRPTTAVLVILGAGVLYFVVSSTVAAMLGLNDLQDYTPSSIVTPQL